MNQKTWIRAASVITLLYAVGHTAGYPWTPVLGPQESSLIGSMRTLGFSVAGVHRTYWDFYLGFGVAISAFLFVQAIVLWQLAGLAQSESGKLKPILLSFSAAFLVNAFIVWEFFFALPLILSLAIVGCLGAAALRR
ncbi:MAG TPA: hypothetical protein VGD47_08430 [Steroidobacteraceae bacterium]